MQARKILAAALVPAAALKYATKEPSPYDEPALRRLENNYARLHVAHRPSLEGLLLPLEGHQDEQWKVTKSKIPLHTNISLDTPVTFRMWAKDAPWGCEECRSKTGALVLVPQAFPYFGLQIFCTEHSPSGGGELWVERKWTGSIELGEAGVDLVERPIPVLCHSLKQLRVLHTVPSGPVKH